MKPFECVFNGVSIRAVFDNDHLLFNLIDTALAAGFAKASSLRYHTQGKKREVMMPDGIYLSVRSLLKVAKDATKTPMMKIFANWAKEYQEQYLVQEQKSLKQKAELAKKAAIKNTITTVDNSDTYTMSDAAKVLGMKSKEMQDWMVAEGYAGRYKSNNNLHLTNWFKQQGYGQLRKITDSDGSNERFSNVPLITKKGLEFLKNRIESQRESNVLSFAVKESNEREKLEQNIDNLILNTFLPFMKHRRYSNYFDDDYKIYEITAVDLIKKVKEVVAQVKVKEKQ